MKQKPACGRARVDRLIEHHEVDSETFKLATEGVRLMDAAGEAVECRAGQHVEASAPCIGHEPIQPPAAVPGTAHAMIDVLCGHLELPGVGVVPQRVELELDVLLGGADSSVECDAAGHGGISLPRIV
jgi:hypothetical protein